MRKASYILLVCLVLVSMTGCSLASLTVEAESIVESTLESTDEVVERPENWSDDTHSNEVEPDYETVFPQDEVNRIDITISAENWETMLADMTEQMGEFGASGMGNFPAMGFEGDNPGVKGQENQPPNQEEVPEGRQPRANQADPRPNQGMGFNMESSDENPIWVTATIAFEGDIWEYVGIRFKGNSSLRSAWSSGNLKIPFKLDFDQFEDDYPEIDDQRFYGFKQLSLASNFNDDSYLREKVTADIFREFGVPSAQTAFYEVYVDYGEGPMYFGLYTMVEMVEDTVIEEQFASDDGNLYKPEGTGATFTEGSFNEQSFDKETNQEEADYSDILSLFEVLHAESRLSDPEAWRASLEAVFDVDVFLRWLAVNTVVQNWDTYGVMNHNYFLYTDPESGLITWIPWDNNHALNGTSQRGTLSLSMDEVDERWPLISYLMDDPVYQTQYETYLGEVIETVFVPEEMAETYAFYHDLIASYALAETEAATMLRSESAFKNSVQELIEHVYARNEAVQSYLSK